MKALAGTVVEAAQRRVLWENAKANGDGDLFARAQAHRNSEAAAKAALDGAIEAYAAHLRAGIPVGGTDPAAAANSPQG
jgi:hypothetical protein